MNCCSSHGDFIGERCSVCELEEKCAHLELARDNAMAMRDEARARSRQARDSAGRRISELLDLVDRLCQEVPEPTRDWARGRVAEILDRAPGTEERVA